MGTTEQEWDELENNKQTPLACFIFIFIFLYIRL